MNILIDGEDLGNRGFMACIFGLCVCLLEFDSDVKVTVFSNNPDKYIIIGKNYLEIKRAPWFWPSNDRGVLPLLRFFFSFGVHFVQCTAIRFRKHFNQSIADPYKSFDVVIHYVADWPNEKDKNNYKTLASFLLLWGFELLFKKPICILPSSMGPFRSKSTRTLIKYILNKMSVIGLREETSYKYVCELKLTKPEILLSCDMAFLLPRCKAERIKSILKEERIDINEGLLAGICPNQRDGKMLGYNPITRQLRYYEVIADTVDYLIEKHNATIILIPHVYDYDDISGYIQIMDLVNNRSKVNCLKKDYTADELKGIIGICDIFIGNWMHSTIAATSMAIPTIALAFSDKFYRLFGDFLGQSNYIIDIRKHLYYALAQEIRSKIDNLLQNRDIVSKELKVQSQIASQQAMIYGSAINKLIAIHHAK